jgi:hypothetical protein
MLALLALTASLAATGGTALAGPRSVVRTFSGTGSLGRYYTVQTVTGTFMSGKTIPTDVTVLNWEGNVVLTSATPRLHNGLSGGYWKQTYHVNAWYLGSAGGASYHVLLPDTRVGSTFTGMLYTEFSVGGNWQNWIDFAVA